MTPSQSSSAIPFLLGVKEFGPALDQDIRSAKKRVFVQTLSFEADEAGNLVADALQACPAPDRRFLIDSYSAHFVNDRLIHSPSAWADSSLRREVKATRRLVSKLRQEGVSVERLHSRGWNPFRWFARDHKKLLVVDDRVAYVGGINLCAHNFAWHDSMLKFTDPKVVDFLAADFEKKKGAASRIHLPLLDVYAVDGTNNACIEEAAHALIGNAKKSLYLHCPYVTEPFLGWLAEAARRGVRVTLVTSGRNNRLFMRDSIQDAAQRGGFDVFFTEGMTHFKLLIADGETLLTGSANFDLLSFQYQPEYVVITKDPGLLDEIDRRIVGPQREVRIAPPEKPLKPFQAWCARNAMAFTLSVMRRTLGKTE